MTIGEYLKFLRKKNNERFVDIETRAKKIKKFPKKVGTSSSYFNRLENNQIKVSRNILSFLSDVYKANISILEFFIPEERTFFVHLPKTKGFEPSTFIDPKKTGMFYNIPQKRLQNSNIALINLKIQPKCCMQKNHSHSGEEILKIEKGNVYIIFSELNSEVLLSEGDVLHFDSSYIHYLENRSEELAECFIIRKLSIIQEQTM